jgi:hypothetical protein
MIDLASFSAATLSLFAPAFYALWLDRDIKYPYYLIRGPHH